ncbi:hypothetical protein PtB15_5B867 [Puccinia triticina]|nr:hypothetical protein PtB15_5B867 [Puccinia triticina]
MPHLTLFLALPLLPLAIPLYRPSSMIRICLTQQDNHDSGLLGSVIGPSHSDRSWMLRKIVYDHPADHMRRVDEVFPSKQEENLQGLRERVHPIETEGEEPRICDLASVPMDDFLEDESDMIHQFWTDPHGQNLDYLVTDFRQNQGSQSTLATPSSTLSCQTAGHAMGFDTSRLTHPSGEDLHSLVTDFRHDQGSRLTSSSTFSNCQTPGHVMGFETSRLTRPSFGSYPDSTITLQSPREQTGEHVKDIFPGYTGSQRFDVPDVAVNPAALSHSKSQAQCGSAPLQSWPDPVTTVHPLGPQGKNGLAYAAISLRNHLADTIGHFNHVKMAKLEPEFIQRELEIFAQLRDLEIKRGKTKTLDFGLPWLILQVGEAPLNPNHEISNQEMEIISEVGMNVSFMPNLASSFLYLLTYITHYNFALLANKHPKLDPMEDTRELIRWLRNDIFLLEKIGDDFEPFHKDQGLNGVINYQELRGYLRGYFITGGRYNGASPQLASEIIKFWHSNKPEDWNLLFGSKEAQKDAGEIINHSQIDSEVKMSISQLIHHAFQLDHPSTN